MTAASTTGSQQHREEEFYGNAGSTLPVLDWIPFASNASDNPTDFVAAADASEFLVATHTVSGVAAGDVIFGNVGVVSGLVANSYPVAAYVTGTTAIKTILGNAINSSVTTTALTANILVLDVT